MMQSCASAAELRVSRIWSMTKRRRAISRRSSASVFGGSATPSAVRSPSRRSGAPRLRGGRPAQVRFEAANAEAGQGALHPVDDAGALADQVLALPVGPLGVFLFKRWDHRHAAVPRLTAQPTQEGALQQFGIEPIRLRPAMLTRHGDTCRVDHMSFDTPSPQPPRQPETIPAGFVGHGDPIDGTTRLGRLLAPAVQELEQRRLIGRKFLQRLAVDPRNYTGDQPGRLAYLDDGNQRAILIQSGERSAQSLPRRRPGSFSCGMGHPVGCFQRR